MGAGLLLRYKRSTEGRPIISHHEKKGVHAEKNLTKMKIHIWNTYKYEDYVSKYFITYFCTCKMLFKSYTINISIVICLKMAFLLKQICRLGFVYGVLRIEETKLVCAISRKLSFC